VVAPLADLQHLRAATLVVHPKMAALVVSLISCSVRPTALRFDVRAKLAQMKSMYAQTNLPTSKNCYEQTGTWLRLR